MLSKLLLKKHFLNENQQQQQQQQTISELNANDAYCKNIVLMLHQIQYKQNQQQQQHIEQQYHRQHRYQLKHQHHSHYHNHHRNHQTEYLQQSQPDDSESDFLHLKISLNSIELRDLIQFLQQKHSMQCHFSHKIS